MPSRLRTPLPCLGNHPHAYGPFGTHAFHEGSAVVVVGLGRRGVGRDNGPRRRLSPAFGESTFSECGYLVSIPRAQRRQHIA
jgi:hypothetical protein